jgi:Zn-dependent membrane protease YugP
LVQETAVTIVFVQALLVFFVIPMVLGFWAQHRVKSTFAKNLQVPVANGMTGAQVARRILDANGLNEVPVEETPGTLSDHYDPRSRSVHLSTNVFHEASIASTAVGAHEVGHAIQHAQSYAFFKFRSAMFPAVQFASNIWMLFLLGGIFLNILGFIYLAIALYAVAVLFQFVTLPVEFDASRRAKRQLSDLGLVASNEGGGVQATLNAAAWTYVAAALAAVAQLLYFLSMLQNR